MKNIKTVISLTVICAVVSLLLALTNSVTAPVIEKQQQDAVNKSLAEVLPGGEDFEKIDISKEKLPETVKEAYSEKNGGYVFKLETTGYGSGFIIMCGINADGVVTGAVKISSTETLGVEATYGEKLVNATADTIDSVDTVANATMTSSAYKNAVKDALNSAIILGGGEADLRTEEEKLADNLNAALPEAEGKFTKMLILADEIKGISAVYEAENGKGYVFIAGENYVGTNAAGKIITETDAETKKTVSAATKKIVDSGYEKIDISDYENIPPHVLNVYKSKSGEYVFNLRAAGYGINGGDQWHPANGEYIYIRVFVGADDKIINCKTIAQAESKGYGDACGNSDFYSQFNGKTAESYGDIDAISGATMTTQGYKQAIEKMFEALKILKGETK